MSIKQNTLYTEDNLLVMNGMNSESVDLIYTDPPFNSKRTYSAPIGSKAAGTKFKDIWTWQDVDEQCLERLYDTYPHLVSYIDSIWFGHSKAMASYLTYMAQRILEMHRILKNTGSFYLHIDPTASHYLKVVCDMIFGKGNFRNEIVWWYNKWTNTATYFQRNHDILLFYTKTGNYTFNKAYGEPTERQLQLRKTGYNTGSSGGVKIVRIYDRENPNVIKKLKSGAWDDRDIYYVDELKGNAVPDVWNISAINGQAKERTGYPTQKPLDLLFRIIQASSDKDDVVFDPFCGCATACVAAQNLDRKWIGIDIEAKARELVVRRLSTTNELFTGFVHTNAVPIRTDIKIVQPERKEIKEKMYDNQEKKCKGCRVEFELRNLTIDHVLPRSKGGQDNIENLQLLCGSCNSIKGDRSMDYLNAKITAMRQSEHSTSYMT